MRLSQSGRDAGFRWTQQSDGSLVVTLLESPAPAQTLTIAAELANNQPRFELPTMRLADAIYGGERLRIYRRPDVQLQVQGLDGWNTDDELPSDHGHEQGRLITALAAADAAAETQPTIARTANRPRVAGKMLIRAIQADGDWRCEANLDLEISNGVLDELRFSLPEELPGPLESEPAMEARMDAVAGDRRREFILHPRGSPGTFYAEAAGVAS